jgi:DNA-binding NarL/FixJ family response regulator
MAVIAPVSSPVALQVNNSHYQIVVVDDYEPWRNHITAVLTEHIESCVIREAADGFEAVQFAADLRPDLVTMDLGLPGLNGIEAAKQILQKSPNTKILFISENRSPEIVQAALAAGGMGYVLKCDAVELRKAVDSVTQSGRYISQSLVHETTVAIRRS